MSNKFRTFVPNYQSEISITFGIVTIIAAVIAEALIVSKKINLD